MSVVLATGGYDHKIRFWDAPSGSCTRVLPFPDSPINKLEIMPNKLFIAAAGNPQIQIFDVDTDNQQPVLTLEGHKAAVTSIGFQVDGRYLYSASEDGTIKIWDLRTSGYSRSFVCKAPVRSVALRQDRDEVVSGDADGMVQVWDLGGNADGPMDAVQPNGLGTLTSAIQAVDISADSRTLVAVNNHGMLYAWDPSHTTSNTDDNKSSSSNSNVTTTTSDTTGSVKATGDMHGKSILSRPVAKFRAHPTGTYCLHARIAPSCATVCTTGSDGSAKLWNLKTWQLQHDLQNHHKWVWDAAFCEDSCYLVTASSDETANLWNLGADEVVRQYRGHQSPVTCVALNDSSN